MHIIYFENVIAFIKTTLLYYRIGFTVRLVFTDIRSQFSKFLSSNSRVFLWGVKSCWLKGVQCRIVCQAMFAEKYLFSTSQHSFIVFGITYLLGKYECCVFFQFPSDCCVLGFNFLKTAGKCNHKSIEASSHTHLTSLTSKVMKKIE